MTRELGIAGWLAVYVLKIQNTKDVSRTVFGIFAVQRCTMVRKQKMCD